MEQQARFVEDTPPQQVIGATLEKLRSGATPGELLAASAVAVSRSTELPSEHHGGPIHPVAGIHAIFNAASWLEGDWALLPLVHNVALANKHIHSPDMGPAIMPALDQHLSGESTETLERNLIDGLRWHNAIVAEKSLIELLKTHSPQQILALVLDTAIRRNGLDDHYFLYPVFAVRALECIGAEWAEVVLRPVVRYLASNMQTLGVGDYQFTPRFEVAVQAFRNFDDFDALLEAHQLDPESIPIETDDTETQAVGRLGERIGATDKLAKIPAMIVEALAGGLSLKGTAEALSYGAALLHLRTDYGNPFDVHYHTGVNTRRYLIGLDEINVRHKILALLGWCTGREIRLCESRLVWALPDESPEAQTLADQDSLLEAVSSSISGRPEPDLDEVDGHVEQLYCGPAVQRTMGLARAYAERGHSPRGVLPTYGRAGVPG